MNASSETYDRVNALLDEFLFTRELLRGLLELVETESEKITVREQLMQLNIQFVENLRLIQREMRQRNE